MKKIVIITLLLLCSQVWANQSFDNKCKYKLIPVVTALAIVDGWNPNKIALTGARLDFFGKVQTNGKISLYSARFTYTSGYSNYSDFLLSVTEEGCDIISIKIGRL